MMRLLGTAAALLVVLIAIEHYVSSRQTAERLLTSTLRPLTDVAPAAITSIELRQGDAPASWRYARVGDHWRYPAWHDAYADRQRIEQLLRGLLATSCTVVSGRRDAHARFGLTAARSMHVTLADSTGAPRVVLAVGRGIPGPGAGETYVKLAAADTVYHLHANPRHAVMPAAGAAMSGVPPTVVAPMLDPHVIPRALERRATVGVTIHRRPRKSSPLVLRRVQLATTAAAGSRSRDDGPTYGWIVSGTPDTLRRVPRVYDYLTFVRRLRYASIHAPGEFRPAAPAELGGTVELEDDGGAIDVLEVGGATTDGTVWLANRTTCQLFTLAPAPAALLLPAATTLLDTTGAASPFRPAGR
jgi:hypothetical protein